MTFIYKLDLKILKIYLHSKNELSRARLLKVKALQTDTQTVAAEGITTYWRAVA